MSATTQPYTPDRSQPYTPIVAEVPLSESRETKFPLAEPDAQIPTPPRQPNTNAFLPPTPPRQPNTNAFLPPTPPRQPNTNAFLPPTPPRQPNTNTFLPPTPPKLSPLVKPSENYNKENQSRVSKRKRSADIGEISMNMDNRRLKPYYAEARFNEEPEEVVWEEAIPMNKNSEIYIPSKISNGINLSPRSQETFRKPNNKYNWKRFFTEMNQSIDKGYNQDTALSAAIFNVGQPPSPYKRGTKHRKGGKKSRTKKRKTNRRRGKSM